MSNKGWIIMSDTIYKIFPKDYLFLPDDDLINGSISLLKSFINGATILWEKYEHPTFIDCGDGLTTVTCPFLYLVVRSKVI